MKIKHTKQLEKDSPSNEVTPLEAVALIKAGEGMTQDDFAVMLAQDEQLEVGRITHSSKSMEQASVRFESAKKLIMDANTDLLNEAIRTQQESKKACKAAKIAVAEIKDQLNKVDSILGDNVENKIQQLERIAAALTTIKALSGDEKTLTIVSALVNK